MQRFSRMMQGGGVRSVLFSLLFSLFFIAVSVSAATTISSNITTDGTLSVTGASTLTGRTTMGYASTTGGISLGYGAAANNITVGGYATVTTNGNIATRGTIYASSTSLFTGAVTAYGDVTLGDAPGDTITITGLASMGYASSSGISLTYGAGANNITVGGYATVTTNGNIATRGTIYASSTSLFTGTVLTYGDATLGDAPADTITITGLASMGYASSSGISLTYGAGANNLTIGGYATVTTNGNIATRGTIYASSTSLFTGTVLTYGDATLGDAPADTITITGLASMGYASSSGISLTYGAGANNLTIGGYATVTTNGNIATRGTIYASSTSLFTGAVTTYGSDTLGDAQADSLTINGGTITHGNAATTTIPATNLGAWAIATSSATVPFVRFDTSNYRVGVGTTSPGRTLAVQGDAVFNGNVDVLGTFTPTQTSASSFTVTGLTTMGYASTTGGISLTYGAGANNITVGGYATVTTNGNIATRGTIYASSTSLFTGTVLTYGDATLGDAPADTITITGLASMGYASSSGISLTYGAGANNLTVGGNATITTNGLAQLPYASTTSITMTGTASTSVLIAGGNSLNGTIAGLIHGTCDIAQRTLTASTTGGFACANATGISTAYKVFVSATSTLSGHLLSPFGGFSIQAASTTAANTIGVQMVNLTGADSSPAGTLNFWAVR